MLCARCVSGNQVEFPSEIAIHFSVRENLAKPHVFVFSKVIVRLDCGFSRVAVAETDLRLLREGSSLRLQLSCSSPSDLR